MSEQTQGDRAVVPAAQASAEGQPDLSPMGTPKTPLWRYRWFQASLGVLLALAVLSYVLPALFSLVYAVRSVLVPVLVGLALAYVLNPLVTWLHVKARLPRQVTALGMVLGVFAVTIGLTWWLTPKVYAQSAALVTNLGIYAQTVTEEVAREFEIDLDEVGHKVQEAATAALTGVPTTPTPAGDNAKPQSNAAQGETDVATLAETLKSIDMQTVTNALAQVLDVGSGAIVGVLGFVGYLAVSLVIVVFVFFFAVWKWAAFVAWFDPYLPATYKPRIKHITREMDRSVSAFIRGRLVQALVLGAFLSIGFTVVGVPYGLLLGLIGGTLNLVPYAGFVVWPIAVGLSVIDALSGGAGAAVSAQTAADLASGMASFVPGMASDPADATEAVDQIATAVQQVAQGALPTVTMEPASAFSWLWHVILPTVVYFIGQSLDAYIVEPVVQGKATNLDALSVLLVVLIGGSLAGLLGLMLAIPIAACLKILWKEVIAPQVRQVASQS